MAKMQKKKLKSPKRKILSEFVPMYSTSTPSTPNSIEELEPLSAYSILVALFKFNLISITNFYSLSTTLYPNLSNKLVKLGEELGTFSLMPFGLNENGRKLFKVKLNDVIENEQKFQSIW